MDEEIKFKDVKIPVSFNKNFIQRASTTFIINSVGGGDFFPNKAINTITVTGFFSFVAILPFFCFSDLGPYIFIYLFLLGSLLYTWFLLTNVKTEFRFSSDGIYICSKKGKLFIPKEIIKSIYVKEEEIEEKNDGPEGSNIYRYNKYNIYFEFKEEIYIPYTKLYRKKIIFIEEYHLSDNLSNLNPGMDCKLLAYYIVQEIKKALVL